jgi:hypothetical protein
MSTIVHELADVASDATDDGTRIWQYVVVLPVARIGADCNICAHFSSKTMLWLGIGPQSSAVCSCGTTCGLEMMCSLDPMPLLQMTCSL